ncbi:MAG: hypothetical protein ACYS76_15065 [Planctomycetota bacterium]|jgi:hypothetical protein
MKSAKSRSISLGRLVVLMVAVCVFCTGAFGQAWVGSRTAEGTDFSARCARSK